MPTPLPTQRPFNSTRPAPQARQKFLSFAILLLLIATLGAGGYAWVNINDRLHALETKAKAPTPTLPINRGGPTTNNYAANTGRRNGRTGRSGMSAAVIAQTLGLDLTDQQITQLDGALQERQQLRRAAQQAGAAVDDSTTADTDAVISGIIGADNFAQIQAQLNAPARGRGARGGGAGGGGYGGGN